MSVALLNYDKQVEISDELEAFFHVIVYYSVRYLQSNLTNSQVAIFIDEYFDIFHVYENIWTCGERKAQILSQGELTAQGTVHIVFDSPMDEVLRTLLSWFHSKLVVQKHDFALESFRAPPSPTPSSSFPARRSIAPFARRHGKRRRDTQIPLPPPLAVTPRTPQASRPKVVIPTAQQREKALRVETHEAILEQLDSAMQVAWDTDKVGDRLPQDMAKRDRYSRLDRTASPYAYKSQHGESSVLASDVLEATSVDSRGTRKRARITVSGGQLGQSNQAGPSGAQ